MKTEVGSILIYITIISFLMAAERACGSGPAPALYWSFDGQKHVLVLGDK